jgi:hypothetical protein
VNETLGVIETIDAENDFLIRLHDPVGGFRQRDESIERDTDRQRSHSHRSAAVFDQQILTVHPTAETSLAAIDKVQTVILNVKTHHVAS